MQNAPLAGTDTMRNSRGTVDHTARVVGIGLLSAAGIAGLLALLDIASIHAGASNSDGATVVLAGSSVANGHLMLSHWGLTWASYWTIDVLFYAIGVLAVGISPALMNFIPALIAVLVILVGMWLAYQARPGQGRDLRSGDSFRFARVPEPLSVSLLPAWPSSRGYSTVVRARLSRAAPRALLRCLGTLAC